MKRIISLLTLCAVILSLAPAAMAKPQTQEFSAMDTIIFGDSVSESAHGFEERDTVSGVDDKREAEYTDENGRLAGGGLGDGLTYRYIKPPVQDKAAGKLEFTMKADPTRQNYLTVRLSGSQQNRGNLMLYGPDGDTSILDPFYGRAYSELDNGYNSGAPFEGRYYYSTYMIPQAMVSADGEVRLSIMMTGKIQPYSTSVYDTPTENSKYIYSAATHTDPYYVPSDSFTGEIPQGTAAKTKDKTPYEYLQNEVRDMTEVIMSWQMYGDDYNKIKNGNNTFLDGAVITYQPVSEINFSGTADEWSREYSLKAINHQNWSPMSALMIYANAYIFDFSGDMHNNPEVLDRYIRLCDFFQRAQDSDGGWCYYTKGEDTGKWLGAALDGSGTRGKGEYWPLLSLGTDAMMQSFIQLNDYIMNEGDEQMKKTYLAYLDEKIDGDMTGKKDKTRREWYIEMFARLRDRLAEPSKGDFFEPTTRAGTANQDFCFAYDANRVMRLLFDSAQGEVNVAAEYQVKDNDYYLEQLKYKFGEMVDGQKWFSDGGLGLEGGASHGGWAGDYGTLLIGIADKYAESASYATGEIKEFFGDVAYKAYETAKYFYYPGVDANGETVMLSEIWSSSRNNGYGQKIVYPVAGYTATKLGSGGASRFLTKYIEDNRAYSETLRSEIESKTPHVYTRIVDTQGILKYYKQAEASLKNGEKSYLPMEKEHPDFAWADADGQTIVLKNGGDKLYVTFNYRRSDWEYNDNTRIHFTQDDKIDRIANVRGTHQGGTYVYEDEIPNGKTYKHTRYDGYVEVNYGGYICGINQSKDDSAAGQVGKTYTADTTGVKKARDLISGEVYESADGEDIKVEVAPRQAIALEVLEQEPVYEMSAKYVSGGNILGYDNVVGKLGDKVTLNAQSFDGYKLISGASVDAVISDNNADNTVTFTYEPNSAPVFNEKIHASNSDGWQLMNYGVEGGVQLDAEGNPASIWSQGVEGENILKKTFAFKELTDDFQMDARLDHFDRTASDQDYFSMLFTDSLDLETANYVELRHFTNNNNILLVSHSSEQADKTTSYWAGDMNNKAVPIRFRVTREKDTINYWYSLDDGKTYEKTTKPTINFPMGDALYVGVAMTAATGVKNTAYISDVTVTGDMVGAPIASDSSITLDFGVTDPEGDPLEFKMLQMPYGAQLLDGNKVLFTPERDGEYTFKASVNDAYHDNPTERTIKVKVGTVVRILADGRYLDSDVSPYIVNDSTTLVPIRVLMEKLGCAVSWEQESNTAVISKDAMMVRIPVGSTTAQVNGADTAMSAAAEVWQDRTMVPLRFVAEHMGASVDWDGETNTVILTINKTENKK